MIQHPQNRWRTLSMMLLLTGVASCSAGFPLNPYEKVGKIVADDQTVGGGSTSTGSSGSPTPSPTDSGSTGGSTDSGTGITAKCEIFGQDLCYEATGLADSDLGNAKSYCDLKGGESTTNATCSRVNSVGGCTQSNGGTSTQSAKLVVWFYEPTYEAESIKEQCADRNETYVSP